MKRILTIGGHDPSNGAGITADLQVMQMYCYAGHSVCTALTKQSHTRFESVNWRPESEILEQLDFLLQEYTYDGIKISLVPSIQLVLTCVERILAKCPKALIIWDPILSASVGFEFHSTMNRNLIMEILVKIHAWIPNFSEYVRIYQNLQKDKAKLPNPTNLKDAAASNLALFSCITSFEYENSWFDGVFKGKQLLAMHKIEDSGTDKRGTGCRYGSVLLAELVKGEEIETASLHAQHAIVQYRNSSDHMEGVIM